MEKQDGDWTLVMKLNGDETFAYNSAHWQDGQTMNNDSDCLLCSENAKFSTFMDTPVRWIQVCIDSPTENCITQDLGAGAAASAHALFSGNEIFTDDIVDQEFINAMG